MSDRIGPRLIQGTFGEEVHIEASGELVAVKVDEVTSAQVLLDRDRTLELAKALLDALEDTW